MLSKEDIEMIKQTRLEIIGNRTEPITIIVEQEAGRDPITGEPIPADPLRYETKAVVTDVSTMANHDRSLVAGVEIRKDDIQFSVDYRDLHGVDEPKVIEYRDQVYEVLSIDHKGLGVLNRVECLGRLRR